MPQMPQVPQELRGLEPHESYERRPAGLGEELEESSSQERDASGSSSSWVDEVHGQEMMLSMLNAGIELKATSLKVMREEARRLEESVSKNQRQWSERRRDKRGNTTETAGLEESEDTTSEGHEEESWPGQMRTANIFRAGQNAQKMQTMQVKQPALLLQDPMQKFF